MKMHSACMVVSLVVAAGMFHPMILNATSFQNTTIKLTVVADSPYDYEVKEVNLTQEELTSETLLRAHTKEELAVSDNNQHMVIVTEQPSSNTAQPDSCAATFQTEHGKIYSIKTQQVAKDALAKCDILTSDNGSLKIIVSHKHT